MSNFWFNIRFGTYFWQWGPSGMKLVQNSTHIEWKKRSPETWKRFAIYSMFGKHF